MAERMIKDLDDMGLRHEKIQLKSDQEPAIITVQKETQELRPNVVPTNSPVGESECNGRVENAIRRIQEKTRALRHQLEQGLKERNPDEAPIMAWMVRWAAELISKYSPGDDGRTPYERIRPESCAVQCVPFGEAVMYLPLKTAASSKGESAKKLGIWLGTIERTEEVIIGICRGVVKCRSVSRLIDNEKWIEEVVLGM